MSALFLNVYLQSFRRQWKCVVLCPLNIQYDTLHSSVERKRWNLLKEKNQTVKPVTHSEHFESKKRIRHPIEHQLKVKDNTTYPS